MPAKSTEDTIHKQIQDFQEGIELENPVRNVSSYPITSTCGTNSIPGGYYDAEKCRAYIANQTKVSKIDRFAAQVTKAIEIETSLKSRLGNILNMYVKCSAKLTYDFIMKCKLGLQRHKQDRILNNQRKHSKIGKVAVIDHRYHDNSRQSKSSISNDLLYGSGVQLVRKLMVESKPFSKHIKRKHSNCNDEQYNQEEKMTVDNLDQIGLNDNDYLLSDSFEPDIFVKQIEELVRNNLRKSRAITMQLNTIRQLFEKMASEHRDNVDIVYAAEEERQAAIVTRRSAYNLSVAAFKATSTPVHVNTTNDSSQN